MRVGDFLWCLVTFGVLGLCGCDELAPPPSSSSAPPPASRTGTTDSTDQDQGQAEEANAEVERETAKAGVGKKGRNYGGGIVSSAVRARFVAPQTVQFARVKQAIQAYKAMHGYLPKTHEVFMEEVIEANSLQLPELPEGERYVYDPDKGELMVERPQS